MTGIILTVVILAVLGLLLGILLSVISIIMAVEKDETAEKLEEILPGANCGSCGFSGCSGYASALAKGETKETALCSPGGADVSKKISEALGVSGGEFVRRSAVVRCRGSWDVTSMAMEYRGIESCYASNQLFKGLGACSYGCIGFGDCKAVCEYDAISVNNGVAKIDVKKCVACGKCVKACPKGIIELVPSAEEDRTVLCMNSDKGALTRKICEVGCIGCGKCMKACEYGAVKVEHFIAKIDYDKCIGCGKCESECPRGCIMQFSLPSCVSKAE